MSAIEKSPQEKKAAPSGEDAAQDNTNRTTTSTDQADSQEFNQVKERFLLWYVRKWSYRDKTEYKSELERWQSDSGLTDDEFSEWQIEGKSRLKGYLASVSDLIDTCYFERWAERNTAEVIKVLDDIRIDHTLSYEDFETLRAESYKRISEEMKEGGTEYDEHEYKRVDAVDFPLPANKEAFYGIAGEIATMICDGTELMPEAVLAQFLCIFGNMLGGAIFKNQGGRHGTLINVAIIGNTGRMVVKVNHWTQSKI
jgi:hypothetical protein